MSVDERLNTSNSDKEDCPPPLEPELYIPNGLIPIKGISFKNESILNMKKPNSRKSSKTTFRLANWTNRAPNVVKTQPVEEEPPTRNRPKSRDSDSEETYHTLECVPSASRGIGRVEQQEEWQFLDRPPIIERQERVVEQLPTIMTEGLETEEDTTSKNYLRNLRRRERYRQIKLEKDARREVTGGEPKRNYDWEYRPTKMTNNEKRERNRIRMQRLRNKRKLISFFEANKLPVEEVEKLTWAEIEERVMRIANTGDEAAAYMLRNEYEASQTEVTCTSSSIIESYPPHDSMYYSETGLLMDNGILLGMDDNYRPSASNYKRNFSLFQSPVKQPRLNLVQMVRRSEERDDYVEEEGRILKKL